MIPLLGRDLLAIYLNDHLAGATAGRELVRRARGANDGTELGAYLETLAREVEADYERERESWSRQPPPYQPQRYPSDRGHYGHYKKKRKFSDLFDIFD